LDEVFSLAVIPGDDRRGTQQLIDVEVDELLE
jgi:hypothetical protein